MAIHPAYDHYSELKHCLDDLGPDEPIEWDVSQNIPIPQVGDIVHYPSRAAGLLHGEVIDRHISFYDLDRGTIGITLKVKFSQEQLNAILKTTS